jgi:hypothetical protein
MVGVLFDGYFSLPFALTLLLAHLLLHPCLHIVDGFPEQYGHHETGYQPRSIENDEQYQNGPDKSN